MFWIILTASIPVIFFCLFLAICFIPEIEDAIGKIKRIFKK